MPRSIGAVWQGKGDNKGDRDVRACLPRRAIIKSLIDRTEGEAQNTSIDSIHKFLE